MKIVNAAAACALLGSSLLSSPALAAVTLLSSVPSADPAGLSEANLATAQAQCDAAAAALDADGPSPQSDIYTAEVVEGAVTLKSGPTEVGSEGDRTIDEDTRVGAGTFTPAHTDILGNPYRNGGSVNMFGMKEAVGGHYSNSAYDFTAEFKTTYNHAYSCDVSKAVYHAASVIPGHPVEGFYTNPGTNPSGGEGSCQGIPNTNPHWGTSFGACVWNETGPAVDDQPVPESWDDPVPVGNVPGGSFDQDQTDTLSAHESFGSGFDTSETLLIGQVVVCISPGKKGGTWTKQNGYTGDKCTTAWYNGGATVGVPNLNDGSHNWVTIPVA